MKQQIYIMPDLIHITHGSEFQENMLIMYSAIQLITIILAFAGLYLIAKISTAWKKMDGAVLRAKAFLNESFLRDNWILLMLICFFFIVHSVSELSEMVGLSLADGSNMFIKEGTELGILVSTILMVYKWFKLVSPQKQ